MTNSANPDLQKFEDIFHDLVWSNLTNVGLGILFYEVPWLALPVIKQVVTFLGTRFSESLYSVTKKTVDIGVIKLLSIEHAKALDKAAVTLRIIAHDKGISSDEFKFAKDNAKIALSKFTRFGDSPK